MSLSISTKPNPKEKDFEDINWFRERVEMLDEIIDEARKAEKSKFQYPSFNLIEKISKKKKSGEE